jgi:hypothetical protein
MVLLLAACWAASASVTWVDGKPSGGSKLALAFGNVGRVSRGSVGVGASWESPAALDGVSKPDQPQNSP